MAYQVPESSNAQERLRHRYLSEIADAEAARLFDAVGVGAGWRCVDIGAGAGSLAKMLSARVGASGSVLATDLDLSLISEYLPELPDNVTVERHDLLSDSLPERHFDLVHARAVLQHLPEPAQGLSKMVEAARPGGWVVAQDADWSLFDRQPMPEPFGEYMRQMRQMVETGQNDHQRDLGQQLLRLFIDMGLENVNVSGYLWQMRGGQPSCEWLMLAMEWALPDLAKAGLIDEALGRRALAQAREADFTVMSPTHISVYGQLPE